MAKLRRGIPPLQPDFIVSPFLAPHLHQEEGTQREGGLGFHPALKLLQDVNQARAQLECELVLETQESAQRYNIRWIKVARRHSIRAVSTEGQTGRCYFSRGLFPGKLGQLHQVTAFVCLLQSSLLLHE